MLYHRGAYYNRRYKFQVLSRFAVITICAYFFIRLKYNRLITVNNTVPYNLCTNEIMVYHCSIYDIVPTYISGHVCVCTYNE